MFVNAHVKLCIMVDTWNMQFMYNYYSEKQANVVVGEKGKGSKSFFSQFHP